MNLTLKDSEIVSNNDIGKLLLEAADNLEEAEEYAAEDREEIAFAIQEVKEEIERIIRTHFLPQGSKDG